MTTFYSLGIRKGSFQERKESHEKSALRNFRKLKSDPSQIFSQIEKEADDDEPPALEVRNGQERKRSPRKSPRKTPKKRKAPDLVKAPTDEEPSTSSGGESVSNIWKIL